MGINAPITRRNRKRGSPPAPIAISKATLIARGNLWKLQMKLSSADFRTFLGSL